jgi:hypothetical protein
MAAGLDVDGNLQNPKAVLVPKNSNVPFHLFKDSWVLKKRIDGFQKFISLFDRHHRVQPFVSLTEDISKLRFQINQVMAIDQVSGQVDSVGGF